MKKSQLIPLLYKIYDPSIGPEDLMEVDLVGPLPVLWVDYMHFQSVFSAEHMHAVAG